MYQSNAYHFRFLFCPTAQYNNLNQKYKMSGNTVNPTATTFQVVETKECS